jgi:hypothetical protein
VLRLNLVVETRLMGRDNRSPPGVSHSRRLARDQPTLVKLEPLQTAGDIRPRLNVDRTSHALCPREEDYAKGPSVFGSTISESTPSSLRGLIQARKSSDNAP